MKESPSPESEKVHAKLDERASTKTEIIMNNMRQVTNYSLESDSSHSERLMVSFESEGASERSVSKSSEAQTEDYATLLQDKQT